MLRAFIIDDEPLARDELGYLLKRSKQVEIVGEADSVQSAAALIGSAKPDVVFVDIELSDGSGVEIAEQITRLTPRPDFVFATAYDDYALKAFELNAADYILKPYEEERILRTVERLIRRKDTRQGTKAEGSLQPAAKPKKIDKLAVGVEDRILLIPTEQINYISAEAGKTVIATNDRRYTVGEPLAHYEQKLRDNGFVRVHRAFLANADRIVEIQPWFNSTFQVIMEDGTAVPVSRTYLKELKEHLGL